MSRKSRKTGESHASGPSLAPATRVRLDKWLWAARFFKTRALAMEALEKGRIQIGGAPGKASREVHIGDRIEIREPAGPSRVVEVLGLSDIRGPAPVAQLLYAETAESRSAREAATQLRRLGVEPALAHTMGRPTKRDRRDLERWDRWSASWEGPPDEPGSPGTQP